MSTLWLYKHLHRYFYVANVGIKFTFCQILTHVSIESNEQMAVATALRPAQVCPIPLRDLFSSIRSGVQEAWQRRWDALIATNKRVRSCPRLCAPWSCTMCGSVTVRLHCSVFVRAINISHMTTSYPRVFSFTMMTAWSL